MQTPINKLWSTGCLHTQLCHLVPASCSRDRREQQTPLWLLTNSGGQMGTTIAQGKTRCSQGRLYPWKIYAYRSGSSSLKQEVTHYPCELLCMSWSVQLTEVPSVGVGILWSSGQAWLNKKRWSWPARVFAEFPRRDKNSSQSWNTLNPLPDRTTHN